jgi:hypothetical protein
MKMKPRSIKRLASKRVVLSGPCRPVMTPAGRLCCEVKKSFDRLHSKLAEELLHQAADGELRQRLKWASQEASAVAWANPYPLLVLPTLMEEKAHTAQGQAARQKEIRSRSQRHVSLAM